MRSLVLSVLLLSNSVRAEMVDRIIAIINNEIVTESDLRAFNKKLSQNGMLDDLLLFGKTAQDLSKDKREALTYVVNEKLLEGEVKRLNLSVTFERVEQEIREIAKRNKVSRTELLDAIKNQGVTISDYQAFLKARVERQSLIEQEVSSKVRVSDEDVVGAYLQNHPDAPTSANEYSISNIVFNPKKGGQDRALQRARAALAKLKSGVSFETVAEQFSEDPHFSSGGALGTFRAGEFVKEFEAGVEKLKVGQFSEIVAAKGNLYILKLTDKKSALDPKFEKEREKFRAELFDKAFQKSFRAWIEMKKEEAFLRINAPEYK